MVLRLVVSLHARHARSYALSSTFNFRNLESPWYAAWAHALFDLISDNPNFLLAPQHVVFHIEPPPKADAEDVPFEEDTVSEEILDGELGRSHKPGQLVNIDSPQQDADTSFASSVGTVHGRGDNEGIVDFAILQVDPQIINKPDPRYQGVRIKALSVPVLVEIKRFCSRRFDGKQRVADVAAGLRQAQGQVQAYAEEIFRQYKHLKSLILIAAAGPMWRDAEVTRDQCLRVLNGSKIVWNRCKKLNEQSSDNGLDAIRSRLRGLSVPPGA